ncbi:MAG: NAD(+) kinase [Cuniculiplasma sp.]
MRVAFIIRKDCPRCAKIVKRIDDILPAEWERIYEDALSPYLKVKEYRPLEEIEADILFTIGGDGTVLLAAQKSRGAILGINMGSLGFLSEVEVGRVEETVYRIIRGEHKFVEFMRLEVMLNGEIVGYAMNEVVVHSNRIAKVRNFKLYLDGSFVERTRADGIIVATPIGSTSYSLSAGGPIVMPATQAMVISYLAPVTLRIRPMVVPSTSALEILVSGSDQDCVIILDGQKEVNFKSTDKVTITRASKSYKFITLRGDFYAKLREKLLKDVVN